MTPLLRATVSAAALALVAGAASAQSIADQVIPQLQAQGFTRIEVKEGPTQVKIEAIRGGQEVEYVYDRATGALLSREVGRVEEDDDTTPGVEVGDSDDDFVDDPSDDDGDDDGPGHDAGDDHGGDDDDDGEDDDRGHGNDADGFDDDNPGRGHGDDDRPGGGNRGGDDRADEDDDRGRGDDDDRGRDRDDD